MIIMKKIIIRISIFFTILINIILIIISLFLGYLYIYPINIELIPNYTPTKIYDEDNIF